MSETALSARVRLARGGFSLDAALELPARGITGVLGESGSGKTTLLRCLAGLEPACRGEIRLRGEVWQDAACFLPVHRRAVGFVFQDARLFPHLGVDANLRYGMRRSTPGPLEFPRVVELLDLGGLLGRKPASLSAGERQRVAIGRALLRNPAIVLMDEPLANLDLARRAELLPFFERLHAALSIPMIYVSHSVDEIGRLCDRLVVLEAGRMVASGELHEVLARPELPLPLGEEAGAVLDAEILDGPEDDGLSRVRTAAGELLVPGRCGAAGQRLRLRVLARDVSLTLAPPQATTILNVLPVAIESLHERPGGLVDVRLRAGHGWLLARISRRSQRVLDLEPGTQCFAQIKAVAVKGAAASQGQIA